MARKNYIPPVIENHSFTTEQINSGIKKLVKRKAEVEDLDPSKVRHDDPKIQIIESNIRNTIREVFGQNSPELQEHGYLEIWRGGYVMDEPDYVLQKKFAEGIPQTVIILDGLISRLGEKKEDLDWAVREENSIDVFWNDIQPIEGTGTPFGFSHSLI